MFRAPVPRLRGAALEAQAPVAGGALKAQVLALKPMVSRPSYASQAMKYDLNTCVQVITGLSRLFKAVLLHPAYSSCGTMTLILVSIFTSRLGSRPSCLRVLYSFPILYIMCASQEQYLDSTARYSTYIGLQSLIHLALTSV